VARLPIGLLALGLSVVHLAGGHATLQSERRG